MRYTEIKVTGTHADADTRVQKHGALLFPLVYSLKNSTPHMRFFLSHIQRRMLVTA